MNNTLEANFNSAMKMCGVKYDYERLIALLQSKKIVEKQFSVLSLTEIKSENDAEMLVSNLVGQDGKIREAVALKVNEFINNSQFKDFFVNERIYPIFLQAIMDINGNVCRQIVDIVTFDKSLKKYFCEKLPESIRIILAEIKKIDSQSRQYVISKRNFQLYWCLEALYNIIDVIDFEEIKEILLQSGEFYDYTIREKTAKILTKIEKMELKELKEKLRNDENYYVRRFLL